jgi:hypothetical protein
MYATTGYHGSRALRSWLRREDLSRVREREPTDLQERPLSGHWTGRLLCAVCGYPVSFCSPGARRYANFFQLLGSEALIDLRCIGITPAQAAVATDAVITAYHAVKRTGAVKSTDTVVIFGLGGLGFNALQIVLAIGSRVIVIDKREEVLADAVNFGVPKQDVVPVGKDPVEFVQEHNLVVDVVIDFVGTNDTFAASQQLGKSRSQDFTGFGSNY